ncbi:hypothetical protein [Clostridium sp.]|jgi:hypothetical protein|uniref:hypothetical protein n=1 Tax=Clostridium sp. TaxID=1506 RepID=UPI002FDCBD9E
MIGFLRNWLKDYKIYMKDTVLVFENSIEEYYGELSIGMLLKMYMVEELERMFLILAIISW